MGWKRAFGRFLLTGLVIIGAVNVLTYLAYLWLTQEHGKESPGQPAVTALPPRPVYAWHEISRRRLGMGSFDVLQWRGWSWPPDEKVSEKFRVFVEGQFACYPQDGVILAVMDETNYQRFQAGYPPIVIGTFSCQERVHVVRPNSGLAIVFARKAEERPKQQSIPQSLGEFILLFLQSAQQSQKPPAKVTAQFDWVVEFYGTDSQARELRDSLTSSRETGVRRIR